MGKYWNQSEESRKKISESAKKRYSGRVKDVNCKFCNKSFLVPISRLKDGRGKYCSKKCMYSDKKGVRHSIKTEFKKGNKPWNDGIEWQNHNYKGDLVGIRNLHTWVSRRLGEPNKCEHCGTTTANRYEWSNISHQYKRELSDWQRLCIKCHQKYDGHCVSNFRHFRKGLKK